MANRKQVIINGQKKCTKCGVMKYPHQFSKDKHTSSGRHSSCSSCNASRCTRYRKSRLTKWRRGHLLRTFGLTTEKYVLMLRKQNGVCAICHHAPNGKPLAVDHDHTNNKTRGLLCESCNQALGYLQDDPELVRRALVYLEK